MGTQLCGTESQKDKDSVHQQLQSLFNTVFYQIWFSLDHGSHLVMLVNELVTRYSI